MSSLMMQDPQLRQQMMNSFMKNPQLMREMFSDPQFMQEMMLVVGNIFAIPHIVLDLIVFFYMWKPNVVAYFNQKNISFT